ncbi:MAG: MAPEG family protein [Polymorphobacter sp.]
MQTTLLTAGLLGLIFLVLSGRVIKVRGSAKVSLGDGGDQTLLSRIRAHANFAEYVPLLLILLGLIEYINDTNMLVQGLGALIVVARLSHAIGMARHGANLFRVIGAVGTLTALALLSGWAVFLAL